MSSVTRKYSISIPEDLAESIRARVGSGGFSGYVTAALRHQVSMDNLAEMIEDHETRHGAFTDAELAHADALLAGSQASNEEGRAAA
ncbi:hypothetical protein [Streptomyces sp. NPDC058657]|uniref:hypothetical protein n=1 Tax=unclassified Streptomyces TaxID=2593676 RepID=UPI003653187E